MKLIDRYVIAHAISMALFTILFRFTLRLSLDGGHYILVWIIAGIYSVAIFSISWILGRSHSMGNFLFDLGLPFHASTYIVWGGISEIWFRLGFAAESESLSILHITLMIWGFFLAVHVVAFFLLRKRTIKGISRSEIFN